MQPTASTVRVPLAFRGAVEAMAPWFLLGPASSMESTQSRPTVSGRPLHPFHLGKNWVSWFSVQIALGS